MKKLHLFRIVLVGAAVAAYIAVTSYMEQGRMSIPLPGTTALLEPATPFDQAVLMADLATLAAPDMQGRKTGTPGGRKAQAWLQQRFGELGLTPFASGYLQPFSFTNTSIKGLVTPGRPFKTHFPSANNVIGYVAGTRAPQRYMVVSAHYDHLGVHDGRVYPGADDNASGVAAMLAIAAYFKAHPPQHSVVFAAFDGEEQGLQGAKAFMHALPFPTAQLAFNLNLDMVSHNDKNQIVAAGTSYTPALKGLVGQAALRSPINVILGHDRSPLVAGRVEDWTDSSDHAPFHDAGIPFLYFGVEDHDDYHAPSDTVEHINVGFFVRVTALLIDVADTLDRQLDKVR